MSHIPSLVARWIFTCTGQPHLICTTPNRFPTSQTKSLNSVVSTTPFPFRWGRTSFLCGVWDPLVPTPFIVTGEDVIYRDLPVYPSPTSPLLQKSENMDDLKLGSLIKYIKFFVICKFLF